MFKFKLSYVALAAALTSPGVFAGISAYTHSSGTTVVNIEAPNAAGVSHNIYKDFSVDNKGVILNNSSSDFNHSTLGGIEKNSNLSGRSASVILNEVTSNIPSSLKGFIEVGGQKADVIIANPNGITCSGCSFINTNKAIMTTGTVSLTESGAIGSYNVKRGIITIDKEGMDASNSYAVLLGDSINLNGVINAQHAQLSAGNFTLDNATGAITSAGKAANEIQLLHPSYSIDISNLGGIKANSISMVGNNLGFGVRNKGAIVANSGLSMSSNGVLINNGTISANGFVTQMVSAGNMTNTGKISTKNTAMITSYGGLSNSGTIENNNQMAISAAGDISNSGAIDASRMLIVKTNGNLTTNYASLLKSDNLAITALGNINNGGTTYGYNTNVMFGGDSFNVTGNISGIDNLVIQAAKDNAYTSGAISNSGSLSGRNITLVTNGAVKQLTGAHTKTANSLTIKSGTLDNAGYMGGGYRDDFYTAINIENQTTKNSGQIVGDNVSFKTRNDMLNEGMIFAFKDLNIDTQKNGKFINRSSVYAKTLNLSVKEVVNDGYKCGFLNRSTCGVGKITADKTVQK